MSTDFEWTLDPGDTWERWLYSNYSNDWVEIINGGRTRAGAVQEGWHMSSPAMGDDWVRIPGDPKTTEEAMAVAIAIWRTS